MSVEVWLRQPHLHYLDSLANGYSRFAYSREFCTATKTDAIGWLRRNTLSKDVKAELLLIGPQGAAHYDVWTSHNHPKAVYPVWSPDQPLTDLQEYMVNPVSDMPPSEFESLPLGLRPVRDQPHVVVVDKLPNSRLGTTRQLIQDIRMLAMSNPQCKLHLHGSQNFDIMFSNGFGSVDFDPTYPTHGTKLYLPNGIMLEKHNKPEWPAYEEWVQMLGFQFRQVVAEGRVLTAFNIRSVHWAAQWYDSDYKIRMRYQPAMDEQMKPRTDFVPSVYTKQNWRPLSTKRRAELLSEKERTDFILCDGCIYRSTCRMARAGAVCSYKGADTVGLAETFGSRNADTIITGLSDLLKMQADRTERAMERENHEGELDPEVSKMINSLMKNGTMLAKLLKPELNGKGVTVNVGVNGQAAIAVANSDPNQLVANAVAALERTGVPRDQITPEMLAAVLQPQPQHQQAIEGTVVRSE